MNDRIIEEHLGQPLHALTDDQRRLLGILTDPQVNEHLGYSTDLPDIVEELECHGTGGDFYGIGQIADRLSTHYSITCEDRNRRGDFAFALERSGDYEVGSYTVAVYLGYDANCYLTVGADAKYLDPDRRLPEGSTGLAKALEIAEVIDGDFQRVVAKARRLGLIPNPDRPTGTPDLHDAQQALRAYEEALDAESNDAEIEAACDMREVLAAYVAADLAPAPPVWPQDDTERAAFADYQAEVANGDTAIGFRDWFNARRAEDGPTAGETNDA